MTLAAGRLRHRITLQRYVEEIDTDGEVVQDPVSGSVSHVWQDVATVWGAIEPLSAREFIASQAVQSQVTGKLIIRYRADVDATCRALHNGKIYQIHGVLADKDSGLEYLTLPVSEGVNDGQ